MRSRQNVWVDGSLRDGPWFASVFADIRTRFPHYKIAIFVISAKESTVRERVARRAKLTGRDISETFLVSSLRGVAASLAILTPLVDFVARIDNDRVPELKAYERVDHSGNWGGDQGPVRDVSPNAWRVSGGPCSVVTVCCGPAGSQWAAPHD